MAQNQLLTTSKITFESLEVLENELAFSRAVNREYDSQFAQNGAKIGATVNVRKPSRYVVGTGPVIEPQAQTETFVPVTLTDQINVGMAFTSADLALSVDDFRERVIRPAMAALANRIDYLGTSRMYPLVYNTVGTPGKLTGGSATSADALNTILAAGQRLDEMAAPMDDNRSAIISPATNTGLVQAQASLFNPNTTISRQFTKGAIGDGVLGFSFARDQNVVSHLNGACASATVSGNQGGANNVQASSLTPFVLNVAALTDNITRGTSFTIDGVYAVNPQSRKSTGSLANFTVAADAAKGDTSIQILAYPVFSGAFQNVTSANGVISDKAKLTFLTGAPDTQTTQNLFFHKNAFTLACADLPLPVGNGESARAQSKAAGLSIRMIRNWYDARTDQHITRIDALVGWQCIYPELAVRVNG